MTGVVEKKMQALQFVATILLWALLVYAGVFLYKRVYLERFAIGSSVTFLSKMQTVDFLQSDADGYVKNLSPLDLYARKAATHQQYIRKASEAAVDFTSAQKVRFTKAAKAVDEFLRSLSIRDINTKAIADVPWVIAMTSEDGYEDGLPHTRANVIFVSSNIDETPESLMRTLIHEKVHVYQRMHPDTMMVCLESRGYRRWKQRLGEPRIRANPDLDPWIYIDPTTKEAMAAYYSTDKPVSITDVVLDDPAFEHPYEKIAYEIARRLNE